MFLVRNGSMNKFGEDGKKKCHKKESGISTLREGITFAIQLGGRLRKTCDPFYLNPQVYSTHKNTAGGKYYNVEL